MIRGIVILAVVFAAVGTVKAEPVDRDGLEGRILCGYQGWFTAEGDGAAIGWRHWKQRDPARTEGSRISVDLLPDVSELDSTERFSLGVTDTSGRPVEVFSSHLEPTVRRHFRWMKDYGIDGVFVQRFAVMLRDPDTLSHHDTVLAHCRAAAATEGRVYAMMYDLTGLRDGRVHDVLDDWRHLRRRGVCDDPTYLHLDGRPLVAVWGVGFAQGREYSLTECRDLMDGLRADGCRVMIGVPTGWRTGDRDAVSDPMLHEIARSADVISPWTVGRYRTPDEATRHADRHWAGDLDWCRDHAIEYLPVIFPGFSWHNLTGRSTLGEIPRRRGAFFERQAEEAVRVGATAIYVAMFDECDEATAIFKCIEPPPGLADRFIGLDGLPADHYLKLTGDAGRRLRSLRDASRSGVTAPARPASDQR